jgi:hypothetical protein
MAYNFKNLADVELLNAMPEEANVLVEVNGKTKRAPNIDVEAKIVGSETLEELPETGTVLAEVNGAIKRVPSNKVGGIDAIVFSVAMTAAVEASAPAEPEPEYVTICNHTPEEIGELVTAGANCIFIASMEGSSGRSISTFETEGYSPTMFVVPSLTTIAMSDGSWYFFFSGIEMGEFMIIYYPDGTIENSLFEEA